MFFIMLAIVYLVANIFIYLKCNAAMAGLPVAARIAAGKAAAAAKKAAAEAPKQVEDTRPRVATANLAKLRRERAAEKSAEK